MLTLLQYRLIKYVPALAIGCAVATSHGAAQETRQGLPDLDCVIAPSAQIDLSSPVPGVLDTIHVERSDYVTSGEVVAELAAGVERASLALAEERSTLTTEIRLGEIDLVYDRREKERLDSLYKTKAASTQDTDEAKRDAELSRWKLQRANDQHRLRQFEKRRAEEVVKQKTIRSTIDGIVVQRFKSPGEYVEDQPIVRIARVDPLFVEAIVPMDQFGKIQVGMQANIVPEMDVPGAKQASVTVVDKIGDAASGTFGVRLELPNPDHSIPAGLKCRVEFSPQAAIAMKTKDSQPKRPAHQKGEDSSGTVSRPRQAFIPAQPPARPSTICRTVGPFKDKKQMLLIDSKLSDKRIKTSRRQQVSSKSLGFIVLTSPIPSSGDTRQIQDKLRQTGVTDFLYMGSGDYRGRISLGTYKGRRSAERRQAQLDKHGFEVEVVERKRSIDQHWLEIELPETKRRILNTILANMAPEVAGSERSCATDHASIAP